MWRHWGKISTDLTPWGILKETTPHTLEELMINIGNIISAISE
jgi:hypothetical protein